MLIFKETDCFLNDLIPRFTSVAKLDSGAGKAFTGGPPSQPAEGRQRDIIRPGYFPVCTNLFSLFIFTLVAALFNSCSTGITDYVKIGGFTQGTTYSISYLGETGTDREKVGSEIEKLLSAIDISLSVYNDSSVISRINRNENITVDSYFREVFKKSEEISRLTDGAFDITVMPLVKAWGFGPDEHRNFDTLKLDSLMSLVGFGKVRLENDMIKKDVPGITLDVNAIAQGYSVDVICKYFDAKGIRSYLVEIGGEVRVKGMKAKEPWKIGIDRPFDDNMNPGENLQAIIKLTDMALATSGNYRKFYIEEGVKYSHTIDPKTGYPARNRLLSATILATDCASADAVATACMVMGLERSIGFLEKNNIFRGYLVYSDEKGNYKSWISEALEKDITEEGEINLP